MGVFVMSCYAPPPSRVPIGGFERPGATRADFLCSFLARYFRWKGRDIVLAGLVIVTSGVVSGAAVVARFHWP